MLLLDVIDKLKAEHGEKVLEALVSDTIVIVARILALIIVFYLGKKLIRCILHHVARLSKRSTDEGMKQFSQSFLRLGLYVILTLLCLLILGFNKHSIATMISAIGLGVGISLKDFLSNLAGGVVILLTRPFQIGQYITIKGTYGQVVKIEVFSTHIDTLDSKRVIIPNNFMLTNMVTNQDVNAYRQIKLDVPISYECDHLNAVAILEELCKNFPNLEPDMGCFVNIMEYGDSSVNILFLAWTKHDLYYRTRSLLLAEIIKRFNAADIEIPYNKLDVTIKGEIKENA